MHPIIIQKKSLAEKGKGDFPCDEYGVFSKSCTLLYSNIVVSFLAHYSL